MSENQTNPGGEGRTEDQNFTAPTPAAPVPPAAQTPGAPETTAAPDAPQRRGDPGGGRL